jgi:ferrous iron transport protein B
MGSRKWTWAAIGYQTLVGYSLAFISFQLGSVLFLGGRFGVGTALALLLVIGIVYLIARPASRRDPAMRTAPDKA